MSFSREDMDWPHHRIDSRRTFSLYWSVAFNGSSTITASPRNPVPRSAPHLVQQVAARSQPGLYLADHIVRGLEIFEGTVPGLDHGVKRFGKIDGVDFP